jgi:Mg2+/Co2+ transporter CorB
MLRLSKQGNRDADVVSSLFAMRERMIGALLLGNNIANIGASALATGIFTAWFGEVGVLYATGVMTVMVVIFAEVLPKTIAINAPDRVSLLVARPMKLMVYLLGRCSPLIEAIVRALMRVLGIKIGANQPILSPTERLRGAVDLLHHEGKVEKQDRDMFGGLLDLARVAGFRRDGPPHRNGDDQCRPAAGGTGARGAGDRIHSDSTVARQA